ncbi:MAG: hypothetical protein BRD55_02670 [Bacteroidetes bacterium SW_9_63_38]|nr:MAG: hypothetical protein BRD55_02670 [Bacteroidetes bacterium SW_9_63_38]
MTFVRNEAGNGGAIHNRASEGNGFTATANFVLVNGLFVGNDAFSFSGGGGAIRNQSAVTGGGSAILKPTIVNAAIIGNTSVVHGGGISNSYLNGDLEPTIRNTLLWGNRADTNDSGFGNGDQIRVKTGGSVIVDHSLVEEGDAGIAGSSAFSNGTANLKADPLLEYAPRSAGNDQEIATDDDGLHPTPGSPVIGAGDNTPFQAGEVAENVATDVTGATRPNGTVDIGAYEGGQDQERTIYVDPSATGAADGTSWADADTTLQDTSNLASGPFGYATGNDEIRIAEGVYTPQKADISGSNSVHVLVLDGTRGGNVTRSTLFDGLTVTAGQADGAPADNENVGGGLYCERNASGKCSPTLQNLVFAGNTATVGGALYNNGKTGTSSPLIVNGVLTGNEATSLGGAIYNNGNGGTSRPTIFSTTIAGNTAGSSGGAMYNNGGSGGTAEPTLTNAVLWSNSAGDGSEIYNENAAASINYSIVEGGDAAITNGTAVSSGTDNLDRDPVFNGGSSAAGDDGRFATVDDSLSLASGSPALDTGTNAPFASGGAAEKVTTDITGTPRKQDLDADGMATVNIGAYESVVPEPPTAARGPVLSVTGATLAGTVNPGARETSVRFRLYPAGRSEQDTLLAADTLDGAVDGSYDSKSGCNAGRPRLLRDRVQRTGHTDPSGRWRRGGPTSATAPAV